MTSPSRLRDRLSTLLSGPRSDSPEQRTWTCCVRVCALANVWLAWQVLELCVTKAYALDEFHYVHVAWAAIYRDGGVLALFTEGTQFVTSLLLLPLVLLGQDNPANMILVRAGMYPFFMAAVLLGAYLASRGPAPRPGRRMLAAQVAVLLALSTQRYVWHGVEIRPDILGLGLTLASVALLYQERWRPRPSAAAAGLLLFLACFASTKVFVYGAVLAPLFAVDLYSAYRGKEQVLRSALFFAAGFAAGLVGLAGLLAATGSFAAFWAGFYEHPVAHEAFYPAIPTAKFLQPFFLAAAPLWILAGLGLVGVVRRCVRLAVRERVVARDWVLVGLLLSTWASYVIQRAAYPYSLIPGIALLVVFATRGVMMAAGAVSLAARDQRVTVIAFVLLALTGTAWASTYRLDPPRTNERQIALQQRIHELVDVDDTVYDMSGTYVYRPRAHRFVFVDNARRAQWADTLPDEVRSALIANETMLFVYDIRFHSSWVSGPLGQFIRTHYQRFNNDLYIWGRRWPGSEPFADRFLALKQGRYFVFPPQAVRQGALRIDGTRVTGGIIDLAKGEHEVSFDPGTFQGPDVYLIWLPRDGQPFDPTAEHPPYYLGRWVLP